VLLASLCYKMEAVCFFEGLLGFC